MDSNGLTQDECGKKRPIQGFRACWACKRRKLQDSSSVKGAADCGCAAHLGERFNKLEQLFEKFVCRKPTSLDLYVSRSPTLVDTEKPKVIFDLPEFESDTQSISSIGHGILAAQHAAWNSAPSFRTLVDRVENDQTRAAETVRRSLVALLPSQHDANVIFETTNGWTILNNMYTPAKDLFVHRDAQSYALDMSAIAQEHIIVIARTLLHIAICMGSMPPEFDATTCLTNIWSLDAAMQNYVTTVTSLVTSSDEQMSTLPGLETLLLLATYHMNSANLRQSWLIIRRAMNLAHLMGFHRIIVQPTQSRPVQAVESAKRLWRILVDLDRYIGLHLRLPFASDDYPCPDYADAHLIHRYQLATICRQVSDLDQEVTPQTYVQALALDEKLEGVMRQRSKDFWEVPNIPSTARSPESAACLERLITHIWHFELKIFIHLPFLLRAAMDSRYEYSKLTGLQASRNVVMRWFALRNAGITQACCRFAELGVFIATVTIALDILIEMGTKEKSEVQKTRGSDFAMVCRVIGEMEKLAKASSREKIAAQSAVVIKKLLSSLDPSRKQAGKTRLTIPYFGTIEVAYHKPPARPAFDLDSDTGKKLNSTPTGHHLPVFSFISNALWPPSEGNSIDDLEFDIVLFDGLEDRDTEGNWVF
ncbi:hypothetical protein K504DRAFT_459560 [Pleomassaria siparia CBS 279.74]|uniref:Xylanolytic transcriptional activator regulatory domain-containing protein n=1 Tax=Pleomassaria siparia CBS 279.74 TaxID=1314801 RepID=A0A6G1K176_9PLEO|nr:hypothetical protein K504DRAFT_459560 [Pleomassaria siparia CBS 279.74]